VLRSGVMRLTRWTLVAATVAVLASCGGHAGSGTSSPAVRTEAADSMPPARGLRVPPKPTGSATDRPAPVTTALPEAGPPPAFAPPDPALLKQLSAFAREPEGLRAPHFTGQFSGARKFYDDAKSALHHRRWTETQRTQCPHREGDAVLTKGKALVTDEAARVRVLTIVGGTGDHAHEVRYFFDDQERLRLLFITCADVQGGMAEHLVWFDAGGQVLACDNLVEKQGLPGWDLCVDENPEPKLDPAVRAALPDAGPHQPRNRLREELQAVDAWAEFGECSAADASP